MQQNSGGVFQWSAISALMFIIYLEDVVEDHTDLNRQADIPDRQTLRKNPETGAKAPVKYITHPQDTNFENETE